MNLQFIKEKCEMISTSVRFIAYKMFYFKQILYVISPSWIYFVRKVSSVVDHSKVPGSILGPFKPRGSLQIRIKHTTVYRRRGNVGNLKFQTVTIQFLSISIQFFSLGPSIHTSICNTK